MLPSPQFPNRKVEKTFVVSLRTYVTVCEALEPLALAVSGLGRILGRTSRNLYNDLLPLTPFLSLLSLPFGLDQV